MNNKKFSTYSGPLHIISFLPKGLNVKESDLWTERKRSELINMNFMLSRPKFKSKYFLRAVFGNYNTSIEHIECLLNLLNDWLFMAKTRAEIIAIATGVISIIICIGYLLLISVFDFRSFINDQLSSIN